MVTVHPAQGLRGLLVVLAPLLASCGMATSAPESIVVRLVDTATVPAIRLPTYAADLSTTAAGDPATPTPTDSDLRTKTPDPNATATIAPTRTRRPGGALALTATPSRVGSALDAHAFGVAATFGLEAGRATYRAGERVWFAFTLTNLKGAPLDYGAVGVILPDGSFHTSLSASSLAVGETLAWRDWVSFSGPGSHALTLAMCFSARDVCLTGGQWVNLSVPLSVTVE